MAAASAPAAAAGIAATGATPDGIPRSISIRVLPASTAKRMTVLPSRRLIRSRASSQTARIRSWSTGVGFGSGIGLLRGWKGRLEPGRAEQAEALVALADELVRGLVEQVAQAGDDRGLQVLRGDERILVCPAVGL